jgi:hypothetical protein
MRSVMWMDKLNWAYLGNGPVAGFVEHNRKLLVFEERRQIVK